MYIKLIFSKFRYKTMDSKKQFDPAEAAEALIAAHDGDRAQLLTIQHVQNARDSILQRERGQ